MGADDGVTADEPAAAVDQASQPDHAHLTLMREMERHGSFAVHAVHHRFQEMLHFLPSAIAQAEGELKNFLESLHELLKK
jgi:hypothetical protein